jgi:putrescine---pyruvate transaminase
LLPGVFHLPAPWDYRNPFNSTDGAEIAKKIAVLFEEEIAFQGADTIAAFIMEPILGAGGVIVPHETFMPLMRAICDKHGILLIADEVITAFGRAGAWSGSRLWGVQPDMMCTAKAITNGYYPFGAVMIHEKIVDVFETSKSPLASIGHGYTYSGHPVGAAAALACLAETKRLNVVENAAARGLELLSGLHKLKEQHELIGDARGKGLMCCLELVSNRQTKSSAAKDVVQKVQEIAYQNGVMVRTSGPNIILSPPLIVTTTDIHRILSALDVAMKGAQS